MDETAEAPDVNGLLIWNGLDGKAAAATSGLVTSGVEANEKPVLFVLFSSLFKNDGTEADPVNEDANGAGLDVLLASCKNVVVDEPNKDEEGVVVAVDVDDEEPLKNVPDFSSFILTAFVEIDEANVFSVLLAFCCAVVVVVGAAVGIKPLLADV